MTRLSRHLPILEWGQQYGRSILINDLLAAVTVPASAASRNPRKIEL
jgi:MFS superfamily sulfate permease-like transporter